MFLYGISYAVASLSCTIGVFISIVATTLDGATFATNVATFVAYGLGMGTTLSILTIAVALARSGVLRTFRGPVAPHGPDLGRAAHPGRGVRRVLRLRRDPGAPVGHLQPGRQWARDVQSSMQRWVEDVGGARLALAAAIVIGAAVAITVILRRSESAGPDGQPDDRPDTGEPAGRSVEEVS